MTPKKIKQAKLMRDNGMTQTEIAEIIGVSRTARTDKRVATPEVNATSS